MKKIIFIFILFAGCRAFNPKLSSVIPFEKIVSIRYYEIEIPITDTIRYTEIPMTDSVFLNKLKNYQEGFSSYSYAHQGTLIITYSDDKSDTLGCGYNAFLFSYKNRYFLPSIEGDDILEKYRVK